MTSEPRSAAYFIEQRDFWFNAEWLALLARRLRLADVRRALDVGSGQGHWTMLLASLLETIAQRLERLEFLLIIEAGRAALGEGDAEVAELVPGMLDAAGLVDVQAFTGDRTDLLLAPYDTPGQRALRAAILDGAKETSWMGLSCDDARRMFEAGGGAGFDARWPRRLAEARRTGEALRECRLHVAGGLIHYLICGRRPAP